MRPSRCLLRRLMYAAVCAVCAATAVCRRIMWPRDRADRPHDPFLKNGMKKGFFTMDFLLAKSPKIIISIIEILINRMKKRHFSNEMQAK